MFSADVADKIYSMWKSRFLMKEISGLRSNNYVGKKYSDVCYGFKNFIMRLDYWGNMYIIECADSYERAENNDFEDVYTYDAGDYPVSELLSEMEADIISEFGDIRDG